MNYRQRLFGASGVVAIAIVVVAVVVVRFRGDSERRVAPTDKTDDPEATSVEVLPPADPIQRGVDYLLSQQGDDGGWRSKTYGQLRGGAANTALVLYALSHLPDEHRAAVAGQFDQGVEFLLIGAKQKDYVCCPDATPDFPTYGTAMLLSAARRMEVRLPAETHRRLLNFLVISQLGERQGFTPKDIHYGGWDMIRGDHVQQRFTSGTNVSVTSITLEAIAGSNHPEKATVLERSAAWVTRLQNSPKSSDGGFFFTADTKGHMNKAEWLDKPRSRPRSYGTATCDGLHCLVSAGVSVQDARFQAGLRWLNERKELARVPGFIKGSGVNRWDRGLRFYYYARLASLLRYLPPEAIGPRRDALRAMLVEQQRADGRWENSTARMREDDPLIATAFALIALSEVSREL